DPACHHGSLSLWLKATRLPHLPHLRLNSFPTTSTSGRTANVSAELANATRVPAGMARPGVVSIGRPILPPSEECRSIPRNARPTSRRPCRRRRDPDRWSRLFPEPFHEFHDCDDREDGQDDDGRDCDDLVYEAGLVNNK